MIDEEYFLNEPCYNFGILWVLGYLQGTISGKGAVWGKCTVRMYFEGGERTVSSIYIRTKEIKAIIFG